MVLSANWSAHANESSVQKALLKLAQQLDSSDAAAAKQD
jgi:hypothetical protein